MNPSSRLRHETGAELAAQQAAAANRQFTVTFETPEELLRFDRQQTPPPVALATRRSLAGGPARTRRPIVVEAASEMPLNE